MKCFNKTLSLSHHLKSPAPLWPLVTHAYKLQSNVCVCGGGIVGCDVCLRTLSLSLQVTGLSLPLPQGGGPVHGLHHEEHSVYAHSEPRQRDWRGADGEQDQR